ncbi:MAG TPA: alpha/beta fold hydrolase [Stellaceae bacterium]|nr:alpha/beta fold hydrolase [Stellaceae bacterium]
MLPWRPDLAERAASLSRDLAAAALPELAAAVERELATRAEALATGLEAYRGHPYRRHVRDLPTVWSDGTTRLIDYGPPGGRPVLVVPSLINRAYILDLMPERSLLGALMSQGVRPLLVDWDAPGQIERSFDLSAYVAGRLEQAFEAAADLAGAPLIVMGYCMGGLLALALALRRQREVSGLVLLATPWDFQAGDATGSALLGAFAAPLEAAYAPIGQIPTDILQSLFTIVDPALAIRKFTRFARLDPASAEAIRFVATEDWLNDGVPLAMPVAQECLAGWYGESRPAKGEWRIAGRAVLPERFAKPALVVLPARDRLVPPASATALAARLPRVEVLKPDLGHIGIVTGGGAAKTVWTPVADWIAAR